MSSSNSLHTSSHHAWARQNAPDKRHQESSRDIILWRFCDATTQLLWSVLTVMISRISRISRDGKHVCRVCREHGHAVKNFFWDPTRRSSENNKGEFGDSAVPSVPSVPSIPSVPSGDLKNSLLNSPDMSRRWVFNSFIMIYPKPWRLVLETGSWKDCGILRSSLLSLFPPEAQGGKDKYVELIVTAVTIGSIHQSMVQPVASSSLHIQVAVNSCW